MKTKIDECTLELVQGDITLQGVDAIVNAANKALAGGAGVDGAIHFAGGPSIMAECRKIGRCSEGQAVLTTAGNLDARYVIHTVGPIYLQGAIGQEKVLAAAYRNSLELAVEKECRSIAFPSLSTGAFRYPLHQAAPIALEAVVDFLRLHPHNLQLVRFVLFSEPALTAYEDALSNLIL